MQKANKKWEEFEISLVDVTNTINGKSIPINYIATYTPNTDKIIGSASADYWNDREDKDANIYLLNSTGEKRSRNERDAAFTSLSDFFIIQLLADALPL